MLLYQPLLGHPSCFFAIFECYEIVEREDICRPQDPAIFVVDLSTRQKNIQIRLPIICYIKGLAKNVHICTVLQL